MFYLDHPLRFECTACGQCCRGRPGTHYVAVTHAEQEAIRTQLGLSPDWFRRRYLERLDDGSHGVRLNADGRCPFLNSAGHCDVYAVRPQQCRTYPFWPELVDERRHWHGEKRRCEGIDRGAVVPLQRIRRALAQKN
jgi:Fe-S-cluster containining protein